MGDELGLVERRLDECVALAGVSIARICMLECEIDDLR